jgi:hypothetical protein
MLDWIAGAKPDHPLADPKRARELIAGLPSFDPPKALEEIRDWVDSVLRAEGFRFDDRLGLVKLLDDAGQPFQRRILRDYLSSARAQKFQESRMWNAASSFWGELSTAYARCLDEARKGARPGARSQLSQAVCRGLRATAQQLKWMQLRYGPIDEAAWAAAADFYGFAADNRLEREPVELHAGTAGATSAELELLKLLMLWATSLDTLSPELLDLAERLTAHFAPGFLLERGAGGQATHCFDLGGHRAPRRVSAGTEPCGAAVFIGAGAALGQIEALRKTLAKGVVPEQLRLGTAYPPGMVDEVLAHLADYWAATPPGRRHNRLKVQTRIAVLHGFDRLMEELCGDGSLNFEGVESWLIEDISAGGFGAVIREARPDRVRIGSLVGTRPEGVGRWGVGIVRRLKRTADNQGYVGVETLGMEAVPVKLRPVGRVEAGDAASLEGETGALWLGNGGAMAGEVVLVLPGGMFSQRESLDMVRQGRNYLLIPVQIRERGDRYDIGCFREMLRE